MIVIDYSNIKILCWLFVSGLKCMQAARREADIQVEDQLKFLVDNIRSPWATHTVSTVNSKRLLTLYEGVKKYNFSDSEIKLFTDSIRRKSMYSTIQSCTSNSTPHIIRVWMFGWWLLSPGPVTLVTCEQQPAVDDNVLFICVLPMKCNDWEGY